MSNINTFGFDYKATRMQTSGATTAALVQQTLTLFADIDAYQRGSYEHYGANIQNRLNFGCVLSRLL